MKSKLSPTLTDHPVTWTAQAVAIRPDPLPPDPRSEPALTVFSSWKEIADFLGKGVRTVQRWERELGLPIHRPANSGKGIVLAFATELEKWARRNESNGKLTDGQADGAPSPTKDRANA